MRPIAVLAFPVLVLLACSHDPQTATPPSGNAPSTVRQDSPPPPLDPTNIVSIAIGSPDHKTLVAALKAADYVKSVANPGR